MIQYFLIQTKNYLSDEALDEASRCLSLKKIFKVY